jgi:hypothetical protein
VLARVPSANERSALASADVSFRHDEGQKCLTTFDRENFKTFECYFNGGNWDKSHDNLRRAATLHGILTTIFTLQYDPMRTEAHYESFVDAGVMVRDICKTHLEAELRARGRTGAPDPCKGGVRGQWCSWPSR